MFITGSENLALQLWQSPPRNTGRGGSGMFEHCHMDQSSSASPREPFNGAARPGSSSSRQVVESFMSPCSQFYYR
jgi:hypothetical protein